ncbi:hypothetical protein D3C76_1029060 [compost metagenome]
MQVHAIGKGCPLETLDKSRPITGASRVMQFEIGTAVGQLLGHAEDRRDADATGKQQAASGFADQREKVARLADVQPVAAVDLLMHAPRATARGGVLEHADQVAMALLRVIAQ